MEHQFWHERWENRQIGFHQDEVHVYLKEFWSQLDPDPKSHVFVPLCGKSLDMLWLLDQDYRVTGIELSPIAVEDFFTENRLTPQISQKEKHAAWTQDEIKIYCGDYFALTPDDLQGVNIVYDRASLIALPPAMRLDYVNHLNCLLPVGTTILLITLNYVPDNGGGPPFSVVEDEVRKLYEDKYTIQLLGQKDIIDESPPFQAKGITSLIETAYQLVRVKE